ncbi:MAG: hypothetical protein AAF216_08085 [Pseudomonadota bacterium]
MAAPRLRYYGTPLGIALITALVGYRIARHFARDWGIWALVLGTAILLGGLIAAIWLWRRGRG